MSIEMSSSGSWKNTEQWLASMASGEIFARLRKYGQMGVEALAAATPVQTGETANSWYYEVKQDRGSYSIIWGNTHMAGNTPLVVLIENGHGTGTGGYVEGREFINGALESIFDRIMADVWKAVRS